MTTLRTPKTHQVPQTILFCNRTVAYRNCIYVACFYTTFFISLHHVRVEVVSDVDNSDDNTCSDDNVNENGDQPSKLASVADECRIVFWIF